MKQLTLFTLVTFLVLSTLPSYAWKPTFAGHRGSYKGVMNTAESYRNGVDYYGYQGLECDVRVTLDGQYVISHDEGTSAVGGNLTVANATLAQLQAENYTQTRGGVTYTGHICTMDTFLSICVEKNVFPIIELKWATGINNNDMHNFPGLYALIEQYGLVDRAVILTSMLQSLIYVRQNYPALRCQYLMNSLSDERFNACLQYGLEASINQTGITECDVKRCHDAGIPVAAWTVNTEVLYRKLCGWGIELITCDYLMPADMPNMPDVDWDDLCVETLEPLTLYTQPLYEHSLAAGNLPAGFPTTSVQAQEACYVDGVFYGNDYTTSTIHAFDTAGQAVSLKPQGTPRHGICRDEAGTIILNNSPSASAPSELLLYASPAATPDTVRFALVHPGQTNFITADGDVYSEQGGHVYFFPNQQKRVNVLHIAQGALVSVDTTAELSIAGSTAGYVIPFGDQAMHFLYQVRGDGYYLYKGKDKGDYLTTASTTKQPGRNSSVGGAVFTLEGHQMLLHTSGTNYNGGFTVKDMSAGKKSLYNHAPLGSAGYSGNPSVGAFFRVEQVDSATVDVHEWCLGNGIMGIRISSRPFPEPEDPTEPEEPDTALEETTHSAALKVSENGQITIRRKGQTYAISGQAIK